MLRSSASHERYSEEQPMLLKVVKMSCGHCVRAVTNAVHEIDPQANVDVSLEEGTVRITGAVATDAAAQAIREEGYDVEVLEA